MLKYGKGLEQLFAITDSGLSIYRTSEKHNNSHVYSTWYKIFFIAHIIFFLLNMTIAVDLESGEEQHEETSKLLFLTNINIVLL